MWFFVGFFLCVVSSGRLDCAWFVCNRLNQAVAIFHEQREML